jgi:predicted RNA methylase
MTEYLPGLEHEAHYPQLSEEARRDALSQWHTDPRLAKRVWRWANRHQQPRSVLEPSAGHGALVRPILEEPFACSNVVLCDVDPRAAGICEELAARGCAQGMHWNVECMDFLERRRSQYMHELFDLVLMNPPYEQGKAEEFVMHALAISERVVGVFKSSIHHGISRFRMLWSSARVTREAKLASRPSFGRGESGSRTGETDYVVLEIKRLGSNDDMSSEHWVLQERWP